MHPQAAGLLAGLAESGDPPLAAMSVEEARQVPAAIKAMIGPGPDVATVRDIEIPGRAGPIPARVYEPVEDAPSTIVYYHGGGWVVGTADEWDAVCRVLAVESGSRVVNVDYRLAPEHRFPAAADDAYDAFVWVAENLAGRGAVVVAGDSAGGNLATVTALRARDEGGPEIALQVLVYPVVDHNFTRGSFEQHGGGGMILNTAEMHWFWDHYAPDASARAHPHASPMLAADLSGLPPAYVIVAEFDPLRDEIDAYAAKLEAAGVPVTVTRFDDQIHGFFSLVNMMESAHEAVAGVADAIRARVAEAVK
jgi:acetyl esterase